MELQGDVALADVAGNQQLVVTLGKVGTTSAIMS